MSLPAKDVHVRLSPEMFDRLAVLAAVNNDGIAEYAAFLLDKAIVGEFHAVTLQAERLKRLGIGETLRDETGFSGRAR
jgi:hypothetical protein